MFMVNMEPPKLSVRYLLILIFFQFMMISCDKDVVSSDGGDGTPAENIKIEYVVYRDGQTDNMPVGSIDLPYGETVELGINITKDNLPYTVYKSILWGTSFPDVLEITPSEDKYRCTVRAAKSGRNSNIGVSVDTGNGIKSATCMVSVPVVPAEKVEIAVTDDIVVDENGNKSMKLEFGGEKAYQLQIAVEPAYSTDNKVEWKSSNPDVATIDKDGWITTYNKAGETVITATHIPAVVSRFSRSGEGQEGETLMSITLTVVPTIDSDLTDGEHGGFENDGTEWKPDSKE